MINFVASKLEKIGVTTGDRKQFQHLQIVFNNKTRSLVLEFN